MAIATARIFPPIGIARLGNSASEFFVGPELPGAHAVPAGGYKDAQCRMKRQAARFRLYGYDATGALVQEITEADAAITWTVHLANRKSSWREFQGLADNASFRNSAVAARATLEVDPGPRTLNGPGQAAAFNTGTFLGEAVPLGEMRTENDGRLLVLGGFGRSASVPPGLPIPHYANNDGWHDDVADGPVTASVILNGTAVAIAAAPAWVICAPPDFAPPVESVTTLYDTLFQVAVERGWLSVPASPSFTNDVFPILNRVLRLASVSGLAAAGHSTFASVMPPASAAMRAALFARVRNPNAPNAPGAANMPKLFDDNNNRFHTITKSQYAILERWKDGTFTDDWTGVPPVPATTITPEGLTRAALEACVGAAFFPGIEASWFMRNSRPSEYAYSEPFRLDHTGRKAGDVTKQMAVPWQADFYECYADPTQGLAWWPAQRPDDVVPEGGGPAVKWIRDIVRQDGDPGVSLQASHLDMVANWHRLGVVVEKGGGFEESDRHVVCKNIYLVGDRSNFSEDEVEGALLAGSPAVFPAAMYVIAEGFLPSELGITVSHPTPAQLAPIAPVVTLRRQDGTVVPGVQAVAQELLLEDDSLPSMLRQRCTFSYGMDFTATDAFRVNGVEIETQDIGVTATKSTYTTSGSIVLMHQPNPYLVDGATSWLSTDLRVFSINEGDTRFGLTMGSSPAMATAFIADLLQAFNAHGPVSHPFDTIAIDQNASRLELSEKVGGKRVFNFAVAQVRYRGKALDATDVRVFFRLFTTAATGVEYASASAYRRSGTATPVALLGLQGGEIVTIPCYAAGRVDTTVVGLDTQTDPPNVRTLFHGGASEVRAYFGCWLDFNQTMPRFANHPTPANGPWPTGAKSIQELIRGLHQCLVAEVLFPPDPIPEGASPAANDNLAQRNLAIVESDNPGSPATHVVQHTFEIKSTKPVVATSTLARVDRAVEQRRAPADELMIRWHDVPRSADLTLFMPDLEANEIMHLRGQGYEGHRLERIDAHTVRCLPGDVTYVPLPAARSRNAAGLFTLALPETVRRGESYRMVVRQLSGMPRRVIGAFQIAIVVSDKSLLLVPELRKLAVLRHIALAIPLHDPWRLVFERYTEQVAARVRGFGGDPDAVLPAADGGETLDQDTGAPCVAPGGMRICIPWASVDLEGSFRLRARFRRRH